MAQLQDAYAAMDPDRFAALLHPEFLFQPLPDPRDPAQPTDWGRDEEVRIHQRMFRPEQFDLTSNPIPRELWVDAIGIHVAASTVVDERPEFYASPANPGGLDPTQARVWGCDYNDSVLFETDGETDYQVTGESYFVVIEDRTKAPHEPGAFLLYRWQDLGGSKKSGVEDNAWTRVKELYR